MAEHADLDIVVDCADPDRVARFWMVALSGYDFTWVPEPKVAKNRLHLDIKVGRRLSGGERRERIEAEVARLSAAGATVARQVDEPDGFWIVMHDVEGNEFCVI
jgi:hypothetical protein